MRGRARGLALFSFPKRPQSACESWEGFGGEMGPLLRAGNREKEGCLFLRIAVCKGDFWAVERRTAKLFVCGDCVCAQLLRRLQFKSLRWLGRS